MNRIASTISKGSMPFLHVACVKYRRAFCMISLKVTVNYEEMRLSPRMILSGKLKKMNVKTFGSKIPICLPLALFAYQVFFPTTSISDFIF